MNTPVGTGPLASRVRIGLLSALSVIAAVGLACLAATATFPLLAGISSEGFFPTIAVTALLVATPVVLALTWVILRLDDQKRQLAAREELLTTAQHIGKLGYWHYDLASGRFILSDNAHELLGDPSRMLRMSLEDLLERTNPADRGRLKEALERIIENGTCEQIEFRITGLDGVEKTFWVEGQRMLNAQGNLVRAYGACQDITERKQIEAALRESEDHYRHAVELNPQIPWTADPEGNILEGGPLWKKRTGFEAAGIAWLDALHPEDKEQTISVWSDTLHSGEPLDIEYRLRMLDGSYRWFRARAAARRNEEGEIVRWYGTLEDVHDHRAAHAALQDSEAFARSILDSTPDSVRVLNLDGNVQFINGPGLEALEADDFRLLNGNVWANLWPLEASGRIASALKSARAGKTTRFSAFCPTDQGTPKWWNVCVSPIMGPDGMPHRLLTIARDMTSEKRAHDEAEQARAAAEAAARKLENVLSSTTDAVITLDRARRFTYLNKQAQELIAEGRDLLGKTYAEAFPDAGQNPYKSYYDEAFARQVPVHFEGYFASHDVWLDVHIYPSDDGVSVFFKDISDRRRAQEKLLYLAHHDALTGLANRSALHEQLDRALAAATAERPAALLLIDLDEFKSVNDSMGHWAGDRALAEAAERLRNSTRSADLVARLGGDEFAVVARVDDPAEATALAARIITRLSQPFVLDGRTISLSASIGIVISSAPDTKAEDALRNADIALYSAKTEEHGTFRVFEPEMGELVRERQALKHELREALARGELALEYQPLIDFTTSRIAGFEALLRWHHPVRGPVPPSTFIPIAESSGLIVEIGEWVLARACEEAASWPDGLGLAVNLSPVQLQSGNLTETVARCLSAAGISAQRLQLEITESVLMADSEANLKSLHGLRNLGVSISMDDFGTGYSSLSYLRSFPFDKIKIDRAFVKDMSADGDAEPNKILQAIIELSKGLGTRTTAEGIETERQAGALRAMGCDEGQGFLFGRPMPAEDIPEAISRFSSNSPHFLRVVT